MHLHLHSDDPTGNTNSCYACISISTKAIQPRATRASIRWKRWSFVRNCLCKPSRGVDEVKNSRAYVCSIVLVLWGCGCNIRI
uniref:Uncharacterized protein n=1 Tax=Arundo donax TaxID=35708 RepID=A0A0A8Y0K6_ARUDO